MQKHKIFIGYILSFILGALVFREISIFFRPSLPSFDYPVLTVPKIEISNCQDIDIKSQGELDIYCNKELFLR